MLNKCEVCYSENWFKPPMNVKAVTQHFLRNYQYKKERKEKKKNPKNTKIVFLNFCCVLIMLMFHVFCVVLCVCFCTGHFVMVPLNLTFLYCLQHSLFEHLFNLYYSHTVFLNKLRPS